jgi:hypothetical protein
MAHIISTITAFAIRSSVTGKYWGFNGNWRLSPQIDECFCDEGKAYACLNTDRLLNNTVDMSHIRVVKVVMTITEN